MHKARADEGPDAPARREREQLEDLAHGEEACAEQEAQEAARLREQLDE